MSQQLELNTHSLVEISPNDWKNLSELYVQKKTESIGYYSIKNYINWISKEPDLDIKLFSLDGDWQSDGTFIIIIKTGEERTTVQFSTLSDNLERLTKALFSLTFKAEDKYIFLGYAERLKPAVDAYMKKFDDVQLHTTSIAWYRCSKDIVATFTTDPPTGIRLDSLKIEDASFINDIWPHRSEGSIKHVQRLIALNISVGAYDIDNKLIAWCLRLPVGALGMLQVLESHKRLGLGSLMVRYISKQICEQGDEVLAPVVTENTPSRKMFEKLGFQKIDNVYVSG